MDKHINKAYSLRIDSEIMDKIKIIAKKENRYANKQIEYILKKYIEQYEAEQASCLHYRFI